MNISEQILADQEAALRTVRTVAETYEQIEPKEATDDDE